MILILIPFLLFLAYIIYYFDGSRLIKNLKFCKPHTRKLKECEQHAETEASKPLEPKYNPNTAYSEQGDNKIEIMKTTENLSSSINNLKEKIEDDRNAPQPATTFLSKDDEPEYNIESALDNHECFRNLNIDTLEDKSSLNSDLELSTQPIHNESHTAYEAFDKHPNNVLNPSLSLSPESLKDPTSQAKIDRSKDLSMSETYNNNTNRITNDNKNKLGSIIHPHNSDLKQSASNDHHQASKTISESPECLDKLKTANNYLEPSSSGDNNHSFKLKPEPYLCHDKLNELTVEGDTDFQKKALELKNQGNEAFKSNNYAEALQLYSKAIKISPLNHFEFRSTILCNQAACHQKLSNWEQVVNLCNLSLELNPNNVKAHIRRLSGFENLEKWNDADQAITTLIELDPSLKMHYYPRQLRIKQAASEKEKKTKEEAMEQFKSLGNNLLGYFGMSVDDFIVKQNEQGSYNIELANRK